MHSNLIFLGCDYLPTLWVKLFYVDKTGLIETITSQYVTHAPLLVIRLISHKTTSTDTVLLWFELDMKLVKLHGLQSHLDLLVVSQIFDKNIPCEDSSFVQQIES